MLKPRGDVDLSGWVGVGVGKIHTQLPTNSLTQQTSHQI